MTTGMVGNTSRLCIHTITTRPWSLEKAVKKYRDAGVKGISIWESHLNECKNAKASEVLDDSGLEIVSYVRGGFFTGLSKSLRLEAIDHNKKMIDQARSIKAGILVLVCGSSPGQSLEESRSQIENGIEAILPWAESNRVKLAVEPLHPVYTDTRSAVNTLKNANDLVERFNSASLGIALDIYHLWWDPELDAEIARCGKNNNIFAVHLSDWRLPTRDVLNDREVMGKGIIDIQHFINQVKIAGFDGYLEVEIFSNEYWAVNQDEFLSTIVESYKKYDI
jgi:sugar phosphate isomerase/epimerase